MSIKQNWGPHPDQESHDAFKRHQQLIIDGNGWRTCINCFHWKESKSLCTKFNALPPPHVILYSCVEWKFEIPF